MKISSFEIHPKPGVGYFPAADYPVFVITGKAAMGFLKDNGGVRLGADRRTTPCPLEIPERRSGNDRRCGKDRRMSQKPRTRWARERRMAFKVLSTGKFLYNS
ncbi:MAG: hypothetical protein PVI06_08740 [Desulfobacterales bacterium]|jgi:hypothetical protein